MKTYELASNIIGELNDAAGSVSFEYEAGIIEAQTLQDERNLEHLVTIGLATVATPTPAKATKPTSKE